MEITHEMIHENIMVENNSLALNVAEFLLFKKQLQLAKKVTPLYLPQK